MEQPEPVSGLDQQSGPLLAGNVSLELLQTVATLLDNPGLKGKSLRYCWDKLWLQLLNLLSQVSAYPGVCLAVHVHDNKLKAWPQIISEIAVG